MSLRMGSNQGQTSRIKTLDKKVPRNPRYADVQSKVKTGMTVDKLTFVTTRQHLRRQEEPYFRLSPSHLHELLNEYEQDRQEGVQDFRDHIDPDHHGPRVVIHEPDATPSYERPYLILDVRSPDEFRLCHITQARSFEGKLLNQDHMTPELYRYKNKEGGLVILYCNEEREACHAATTLIHRGFNNVFVLSTGIVGFARNFRCFIEGDTDALPSVPGTDMPSSTRSRRPRRRETGGGSSGSLNARDGTCNGSARGGSDGNSEYGTTASLRSSYRSANGHNDPKHAIANGRQRNAAAAADRGLTGNVRSKPIAATSTSIRLRGARDVRVNNDHNSNHGRSSNSGRSAEASHDRTQTSNSSSFERRTSGNSVEKQRALERGLTTSGRCAGDFSRTTPGALPSQQRDEPSPLTRDHAPSSDHRVRPRANSRERPNAHDFGESSGGWAFGLSGRGSFSGRAGADGSRGLAEAAAAASAARRRSLGSGNGGGGGGGGGSGRESGGRGDFSRGSAVTVADSVISRATARRGRW